MSGTYIELRIPLALPSLNGFVNTHWSRYHKQRKEWRLAVWVAKTQARGIGDPRYTRVRMTIERRAVRLILDDDNLQAGRKFLQDALVHNGILLDDTRTVIEECQITQTQVPRRKTETVVRIFPLTDGGTGGG